MRARGRRVRRLRFVDVHADDSQTCMRTENVVPARSVVLARSDDPTTGRPGRGDSAAHRDHRGVVSLNQFISAAVAEKGGRRGRRRVLRETRPGNARRWRVARERRWRPLDDEWGAWTERLADGTTCTGRRGGSCCRTVAGCCSSSPLPGPTSARWSNESSGKRRRRGSDLGERALDVQQSRCTRYFWSGGGGGGGGGLGGRGSGGMEDPHRESSGGNGLRSGRVIARAPSSRRRPGSSASVPCGCATYWPADRYSRACP